MSLRPLGRNRPTDLSHVSAYPLTEAMETVAAQGPTPVVAGTDWFTSFDRPTQGSDGRWRVPASNLGTVRGGHCYCLEPVGEKDTVRNWTFYDQGDEGACEGFGNSRALTILTGGRPLDGYWLYDDARRIEDTYPGGEGSTNRAAAEALKRWGAHLAKNDEHPLQKVIERVPWQKGVPAKRIASYHWATTVEEIRQALGYGEDVSEFPLLNSWGQNDYPHRVYMPEEAINTLLVQGAEYTVLVLS